MSTDKSRPDITLSDDVREALMKVSQRDRVPQATKAARFIQIALELEEDRVWDEIAARRDKKTARYIPHDKVWE